VSFNDFVSQLLYESNKNVMFFCHVLDNIGFLMNGNLVRAKSVLQCSRHRLQRYEAAAAPSKHW
jgi:hypothetical protein